VEELLSGLCDIDAVPNLAPVEELEMEELAPPGWGTAALLGPDFDDDDDDDESFAGGGDDEDEEFVDEELLPEELDHLQKDQGDGAVALEQPAKEDHLQKDQGDGAVALEQPAKEDEEEAVILPPGKKRARPEDFEQKKD
jgi:hypothetical protein